MESRGSSQNEQLLVKCGLLKWFRNERGGSLGTSFALKKASASDRNVSRTTNSQSWYLENHAFLTCQSCQQGYAYMYVCTYVCLYDSCM